MTKPNSALEALLTNPKSRADAPFSPATHTHYDDLRSKEWVVTEAKVGSNICVSHKDRIAKVPFGRSRVEQVIRAHEAGHLHHSPLSLKEKIDELEVSVGTRPEDTSAVVLEEVNINGRLLRGGMGITLGDLREVGRAHSPDSTGRKTGNAIRSAIAARDSDKAVSAMLGAIAAVAYGHTNVSFGTLPVLLKRAIAAAVEFRTSPSAFTEQVAHQQLQRALAYLRTAATAPSTTYDENAIPKNRREKVNQYLAEGGSGTPQWAPMAQQHLPLTISTMPSPTWVSTGDPNGHLHKPIRLGKWQDKVAWRRKRQMPTTLAPSMVIDCSGSMGMTAEKLKAILTHMPASNIAIYAGEEGYGYLVVVARNGKMAHPDEVAAKLNEMGGNNLVDGPALEWLSGQPEPRVWVSDGEVTGVGGSREALLLDAATRCMKNRIKRVDPGPLYATLGIKEDE